MNGKLIIAGAALVFTLGACGSEAQQTTPSNDQQAPQEETKVTTPETEQVAATYDLKIEGMT